MQWSNENYIKRMAEALDLSKPVFIIGGGPSLNTTLPDETVLKGHNVITTNNAFLLNVDPIVAHFADLRWYHLHVAKLNEKFKNNIDKVTTADVYGHTNYPQQEVTVFQKVTGNRLGISFDPAVLFGNNAGHQAINIAVLLGFKNIILLGFDMDKEKQANWHVDHIWDFNKELYADTMIPQMNQIAKELNGSEIKIYNANPESAIKCFEFCDIKDWL